MHYNFATGTVTLESCRSLKPAPPWPLSEPPTQREQALWLHAWERPVSVLWQGEDDPARVATYVRKMAYSEQIGSDPAILIEALDLADSLCITHRGREAARVVLPLMLPQRHLDDEPDLDDKTIPHTD